MISHLIARILAIGTVAASCGVASAQVDIARWSFATIIGPPYNSPPPTTVLTTASAITLGMDNNYNGGNTASDDTVGTTGNPDPFGTQNTWRIRGTPSNGWALAAPQYTQGVEFDVSTAGYRNVILSFDWYCTMQGIRDLQVQYNLNVNNQNGWVNFQGSFIGNVATEKDAQNNTLLIAGIKDYNTNIPGTNVTMNRINFLSNGIRGVDNNPNFGIRLVSAYDPSTGSYSGASGGIYNNSSGNWRFDQVAFRSPFPLPILGIPHST